jgi:pilus assembly protein CpaE
MPDAPAETTADEHISPAPRVSVQAFCETVETAAAVQSAGEDRRMVKAHVKIQMGGATAAVEAYRSSPTPNVILIESDNRAEDILTSLDQLAEVCDAGTRVVVVGRINDVMLYRELTKRGVSDYLIAPVGTIDIVRALCGLFVTPDAKPVGRIIAVVGAKGGVGASTVAHNVAWAIARDFAFDSVVTDLDLPFGTAGLDYNQDPPQGIADAVFSPDRIDTAYVDRLLSKCTDRLSLLAAPATLDRVYDFGAEAFDSILDSLRHSIPCVVLDVPHVWTGWTRRLLVSADDILVVAAPDLANLRNAKNMVDVLRGARPNDHRPYYCLNQVGVPKRPEISPADFAKALEDKPLVAIPFEPQLFGTAANNGQMIAEVSAGHKTAEMFRQLAQVLTGRTEAKRARGSLLSPLLAKFKKRASWARSMASISAPKMIVLTS